MKGAGSVFKYCVTVPENIPEMSLQNYVAHAFPLLPGSVVRDAFSKRDVKMNGARCGKDAMVEAGAQITVFTGHEMKMPVVYEDDNVLVINKPAGVSTDTDKYNSMTVLDWAVLYAKGAYAPRMCHRLDNATSGLIVLAKNDIAEEALQEMFRTRSGEKEYRCIVRGTPSVLKAVKTAYLQKDALHGRVRVSDVTGRDAKQIVTEYEVLRPGEKCLVRVLLHTGRTHQIRAHMRHLGHPLLGDDVYGDRQFNKKYSAKGLMLCAVRLKIDTCGRLPAVDGKEFSIRAPFE